MGNNRQTFYTGKMPFAIEESLRSLKAAQPLHKAYGDAAYKLIAALIESTYATNNVLPLICAPHNEMIVSTPDYDIHGHLNAPSAIIAVAYHEPNTLSKRRLGGYFVVRRETGNTGIMWDTIACYQSNRPAAVFAGPHADDRLIYRVDGRVDDMPLTPNYIRTHSFQSIANIHINDDTLCRAHANAIARNIFHSPLNSPLLFAPAQAEVTLTPPEPNADHTTAPHGKRRFRLLSLPRAKRSGPY